MIIGLSLIHVQFLLVWANNGRILVQSIQWLNSLLFVLDVYGFGKKKKKNHFSCVILNSSHFTLHSLETNRANCLLLNIHLHNDLILTTDILNV